jgi:hypothetical protein
MTAAPTDAPRTRRRSPGKTSSALVLHRINREAPIPPNCAQAALALKRNLRAIKQQHLDKRE